ncbi:hypothetical protein CONPUDRAFT_160143 [Coniophora puteana RWD-64-598 SS2]|uniref:Hydrophobin n=1 Tax=Coniophora puteana (strain RWD-64-598) TaxID=741705 RepID=R7SFB8_CONPW|nr:uncharacterized protein CONPUDRAFT_160143 [Coniophora puteana RWD-64-598 SS2]EIW74442.1 hypothetical protein CONPUDRAFT_160143 [Coniophora puteana RWD-64-598 SS2]
MKFTIVFTALLALATGVAAQCSGGCEPGKCCTGSACVSCAELDAQKANPEDVPLENVARPTLSVVSAATSSDVLGAER